ncbi:hypothetical protein Chor_014904 [Crotalus horridus]
MSRWFFPWSSSIKKRACRYLLQHYLGHFLEERLGLEQLSLDLYAGAGRLTRLHLDVWSVNEFLQSVGAPLEVLDGFIDSIAVTIPWSALVTENCTVEVSGLQITCRPKYRQGPAGPEGQSWASSMTTSMQLAQECLKEQTEEPSDPTQPLEGLEMFAQTIETVLRRIEVTFVDTVIRVEHTPRSGEAPSVALEIHIKRLEYCDEVVRDPGQALTVDIHQLPPFVQKILQLSNVLLYYEEFGEGSARGPKETEPCDSGGEEARPSPLTQIGSCSGHTEMRIKLKQNEAFPGAKEQLSKNRPLDSEDLKLIEQDLSQQLHSGLASAPAHLEGMAAGVENGEMFFSMAPMTSSVTSLRSVSDLSDLDSSVHSDISTTPLQPPTFVPGLLVFPSLGPVPYSQAPQPCARIRSKHLEKLPSSKANVQLVAPKGSLLLQFPIPDLRVWAERRAWAEKAVRRERLRLDLAGVELHTDLEPTGPVQLEVTLTDLHAPDLLARGIGKKYLLPKLILTFCPTPTDAPWDLALAATEEVELSTVESPCELKQPEPSPFSSKRTMYETEEDEGGKKLEAAHGELVLDVENGSLFSVSHYKGCEDFGYFCIEAEKVALYHKGRDPAVVPACVYVEATAVVEDYLTAEHLEIPNFLPPEGLHPTIYASQEGSINWPLGAKKDVEFLVTLRLEGATIRHRMALAHQSWYTQLIDFLDVLDDPILGFVPPAIITVLHTHLFNCAMDYRCRYWKLGLFELAIGCFEQIPSHVQRSVEKAILVSVGRVDSNQPACSPPRFILDNSTLFLSNKCEAETGDLNKDYVCVVEMDLLELVITTWKGDITGKLTRPLFELRCSNNVVHIHTCADSCAALGNLIQYLPESPASLPTCPPAETAAINQRDLTDALMDTERGYPEMTGDSGMRRQPSPVSVYLFPGEKGVAGQGKAPPPPVIPVGEGLDFTPSEDSEGESEATDGFCILDAPGTGIPPRDGEPVVTKLLDGPVHIQEGHFSRPLGSTDLLKAPSHFPMPESRVVMREISVVWHLYGGRDFGPGRSASGHMHSPRTKSTLPSTRSSPSRSAVPGRPQSSWRAQGGPGRIHDLLMEIQLTKVSFQHESYSGDSSEKLSVESEEQPLARQVFIVQELEIRDRLASSQINKFLYLYSSELLPRRAHSNMGTFAGILIGLAQLNCSELKLKRLCCRHG